MYESKSRQAKQDSTPHRNTNKTGIPLPLKEKYEALSGLSFDDVKVHYNSSAPAQMYAHAYTCGNHIYVAPGQEKHLDHELGHVIQQKQGLVRPDTYIHGLPLNTDCHLEAQADAFSRSAAGLPSPEESALKSASCSAPLVQRAPFSMAELLEILDSPLLLAGVTGLAAALGISLYAAMKLYAQCFRRPKKAEEAEEAKSKDATPPSGEAQKPEAIMSSNQTSAPSPSRLVGNCLYDAVADALGQPVNANYYRELTSDYIRELYNRDPNIFQDSGIDIDELLSTVDTPQAWDTDSGDMVIEFLALALEIHIVVHTETYNWDVNPDGQTTLHLRLEGNHYTVYQPPDVSSVPEHDPDMRTTDTAISKESVTPPEIQSHSAEEQSNSAKKLSHSVKEQYHSTEEQRLSEVLDELAQFINGLPEKVKQSKQNTLNKMKKNKASYQELVDFLETLQRQYKPEKTKTRPDTPPVSLEQNPLPQQPVATPDPIAAVLTPTRHSSSSYCGSACHPQGIVRRILQGQDWFPQDCLRKTSLGHQGGNVSKSSHKKRKNKLDCDNTGKLFVVIIDGICYEMFSANHSGQGNQQYTIISSDPIFLELVGKTIKFEKKYIKIEGTNDFL